MYSFVREQDEISLTNVGKFVMIGLAKALLYLSPPSYGEYAYSTNIIKGVIIFGGKSPVLQSAQSFTRSVSTVGHQILKFFYTEISIYPDYPL